MIKKIISGGQTGTDRAALDFAIKFDIPHGGWIPKGRKTEDGPLPEFYRLQEIPDPSYTQRTEKNVLDSDGTLIISRGDLTGGSQYTGKMAIYHQRPWLHIDLNKTPPFSAGKIIRDWIKINKIEVLNVAGPRSSKEPSIYQAVFDLLETVFYMDLINTEMPGGFLKTSNPIEHLQMHGLPKTVNEAAEKIISGLSFRDRTKIANLQANKLEKLRQQIDPAIRKFTLESQNSKLLESCRAFAREHNIDVKNAEEIIAHRVWKILQLKKNVLRIVK